jgi:hypothetical protein
MALLSIDFVGEGAESAADDLRAYLAETEPSIAPDDGKLVVEVEDLDDCARLGGHIAAFVAGTTAPFKLWIDGPGGTTTLHQLRTDQDAEVISGYLATCAYFQ